MFKLSDTHDGATEVVVREDSAVIVHSYYSYRYINLSQLV